MTHILSILRAAHCRSTHHYFALDALQNLKTAQAQRLAHILLKYHDDYLVGAKAPDSNFKDFQNHVIHVSDDNWGGAAQKCQEWLTQARQYMDEGKWKKAAYACGVLSHYFTDPIMPLHTAQHLREQVVHRPMEWSICQSYQEIYSLCNELGCECDFAFSVDDQWISKAVRAAAAVAHRHYDRLVAIYDVARGVAKPRAGLNDEAMTILAELFALAIGGWARVLTRLADETTKELPQVSLTMTSLLATIDMPLAWIVRRISDAQERRAVQAVFNEYNKTGSLKHYLPAEISVVRDAKIANPKLGQQPEPAAVANTPSSIALTDVQESPKLVGIELPAETLSNVGVTAGKLTMPLAESTADAVVEDVAATAPTAALCLDVAADLSHEGDGRHLYVAVAETKTESLLSAQSISATASSSSEKPAAEAEAENDLPQFISLSQARGRLLRVHQVEPSTAQPSTTQPLAAQPSTAGDESRVRAAETADEATAQLYLESAHSESTVHKSLRIAPGTMLPAVDDQQITVHYGSPLVDAPSIGPKTAKRFENIGITTIRQLISTSPESIVRGLATRWITESLVQDWQDQARLVCEVPALSGYRAQLLVAVGCRTSWQLRTGNLTSLHTQISQFCQTSEGQQILLSARLPQEDDVAKWVESARVFARRDVA